MEKRLAELVNEDFEFHFKEVIFITFTKSCKPQIIISKVR